MARNIAIACQGGGSFAAYTAGALPPLLEQFSSIGLAPASGAAAGAGDRLNLVGISGTSGGAISALLAWYGFLTGGAQGAAEKLHAFWDASSTQWIGEEVSNRLVVNWANSFPYDIKFSPYFAPLREAETITTRIWPVLAELMGGFNCWFRRDFFQLDELVAAHVDFGVIGALGEFASIPAEIRGWQALEAAAAAGMPGALQGSHLEQARQRVLAHVETKLAAAQRLRLAMDTAGVPANALLRQAFGRWKPAPAPRDAGELDALAAQVLDLTCAIPQLLVGAVEVDSGAFTAFSSERAPNEGGISLDAVLASAALPWLFPAREILSYDPLRDSWENRLYWDGLFSQNPPIRNFISGLPDPRRKPDGIWILQINPDKLQAEPRRGGVADALSGNGIWQTRDALAGNLSLNQEVSFVEAINRRIGDGGAASDKHIGVDRIVMDASAVRQALPASLALGVASKFDRSALLKDALMAHGREQAARFIELRGKIGEAGESLGEGGVRFVVDGITVHRDQVAQGTLGSAHWHARGAHLDGGAMTIEGDTGLDAQGPVPQVGRLSRASVRAPARPPAQEGE